MNKYLTIEANKLLESGKKADAEMKSVTVSSSAVASQVMMLPN